MVIKFPMAQTTTPFNAASKPDIEPWGLWNVIRSGDLGGMKRILAAYPDAWKVAVKDAEGFTKGDQAIHVAARGDTPEIVDYLLSLGATLEDRNTVTGETPLMASLGST